MTQRAGGLVAALFAAAAALQPLPAGAQSPAARAVSAASAYQGWPTAWQPAAESLSVVLARRFRAAPDSVVLVGDRLVVVYRNAPFVPADYVREAPGSTEPGTWWVIDYSWAGDSTRAVAQLAVDALPPTVRLGGIVVRLVMERPPAIPGGSEGGWYESRYEVVACAERTGSGNRLCRRGGV